MCQACGLVEASLNSSTYMIYIFILHAENSTEALSKCECIIIELKNDQYKVHVQYV